MFPGEAAGERLDRFLVAHMEGVTRAALTRWIRDQRVRVDGRPAGKAGLPLKPGMLIRVEIPAPPPERPEPEELPFDIVYQDDDLLVIDKPAGLTVHPGHGTPHGKPWSTDSWVAGCNWLPSGHLTVPGIVPPPGPRHVRSPRRGQERLGPPRSEPGLRGSRGRQAIPRARLGAIRGPRKA